MLLVSLLKETETLVLSLHRTEFSPQSDEPQNGSTLEVPEGNTTLLRP